MRVQTLATAPVFAETLKVWGPYLPHHWSDWPKILDLVLWVPNQHVCQVSLKSETVGFNSLGDLTQNDPLSKALVNRIDDYTTASNVC